MYVCLPLYLPLLSRTSVDSKIEVKKQGCGSCRNKKTSCSRILISSKSKKLIIRRLWARHDHEKGLESWDLACFRYPEHPNFKDLEVLRKAKYLSVHFTTLPGKRVPTHLPDGRNEVLTAAPTN